MVYDQGNRPWETEKYDHCVMWRQKKEKDRHEMIYRQRKRMQEMFEKGEKREIIIEWSREI